jgi:hypothetical protein
MIFHSSPLDVKKHLIVVFDWKRFPEVYGRLSESLE